MKTAVLLVFAVTLLAGCQPQPPQKAPQNDILNGGPMERGVCTDAQMQKAESEAKWCSDNTTYFSTYCYNAALKRNCTVPAPSTAP